MSTQHPANVNGMEWAAQRGMGTLAQKMGMQFVEFTVERSVATMPVEGNTQPVGLMHGGAYVVLGESLGSMSANLWAGPGRLAVGVDINATHTRSARSGLVTGVCTPVHLTMRAVAAPQFGSRTSSRMCRSPRNSRALRREPASRARRLCA